MNRLLLSLLALLALAACGGNVRPDDGPVVVSAIGGPARAVDPAAGPVDPPARVLLGATAQGLVRFDAVGQIEPGLAERWIVIDDGLSYIFRLREAQWPDGEAVTADQVARALRRAIAAERSNPLRPFTAVISEIVAMTPEVLEVRLRRPRPDLLHLFAQPELAVFRDGRPRVGSGPFRVRQESGPGVLLRPAFDPTMSPDDEVEEPSPEDHVQLIGERATMALARFKAGRSDLVLGGSFLDWPIVQAAGPAPANVHVDPAAGLFGLAIVERRGFLADAANRAAVAMAIDRATLTALFRPDWTPVETVLPAQIDSAAPPTQPAWAPLPLDARRENARARVRAWQRANPGDPLEIRIALPQGPGGTLVWAEIGSALVRIGLNPRWVAPDADADLRLVDEVAPYDSGRWYLRTACRLCADDAATLIEAARDAPSLDARSRRIAEADAALTADSAFIPIAQPLRWSIVSVRLQAWQRNSRAWHPLNHLRKSSE